LKIALSEFEHFPASPIAFLVAINAEGQLWEKRSRKAD
jgi:hypothetical protein